MRNDFGSGYSSLNTLSGIKIDELKIDRKFLLNAYNNNDSGQMKILSVIVAMAKELNFTTVVEGVETVESEKTVKDLGCDYGQGFYYSRPIMPEEFCEKFIRPFSEECS